MASAVVIVAIMSSAMMASSPKAGRVTIKDDDKDKAASDDTTTGSDQAMGEFMNHVTGKCLPGEAACALDEAIQSCVVVENASITTPASLFQEQVNESMDAEPVLVINEPEDDDETVLVPTKAHDYSFTEHDQDSSDMARAVSGRMFDTSKPALAMIILAAAYLVYKAHKMSRGKDASRNLSDRMYDWRESLERTGRPCNVGNVKVFRFDTSNYESLTSNDLKKVLLEGFNYKARSSESKPHLICKLCDKYEAVLKAMKKSDICGLLEAHGYDASDSMKKNDLVLLALEFGF